VSDVILFQPKAELDAAANLAGFVESCRNDLTVFGANLDFDANAWDITETVQRKGTGNKRERLVFSTLETVNDKPPKWMADEFLPFAKAFMRYMHGLRPSVSIGLRLAALRALESALSEGGLPPNPTKTDASILNRAAQIIVGRHSKTSAYHIGRELEMISKFLSNNQLTTIRIRWRNPIKRALDTVRVGKEFDERRNAKMPSEAALDALPKVFRLAVEPGDAIVSSVAAILCSSPDRINEVLLLPEQCEVRQKHGKDGDEAYGLRWWPAKGADPMVKWIVPSMVTVVQEAIEKIRKVSEKARQVAKWYENHPCEIYIEPEFEYLRGQEWLSMKELGCLLGMTDRSSPLVWCKSERLEIRRNKGFVFVRFSDVQNAVVSKLPIGFPVLNQETGLKYSDALLVVRTNELHNHRNTYPCMIESVTTGQISVRLGNRAKQGFPSIFIRFGFDEPDGSHIKVTTHQFRHYLNTLAQAGGMSQLDIAKWSGRKDIRQNAAYDHVTPDQMLQKIRDAIGDESLMFGPLAEIPKKSLIPRDEFDRLIVPTAHTTDFGFCVHDYTMSPCQLHKDCIHCEDLVCVKGDEAKTRRLRQHLEDARELLRKAETAVGQDYAGSDRWLAHHKSTVERLTQLCSIMDDPNVPIGSLIQMSPPRGTVNIEESSRSQLPPAEAESIPDGLLADIMAAMGG
jgi:hypothetical protein